MLDRLFIWAIVIVFCPLLIPILLLVDDDARSGTSGGYCYGTWGDGSE